MQHTGLSSAPYSNNPLTLNPSLVDPNWVDRLDYRAPFDTLDGKGKLLMLKGETPLFVVTRKNSNFWRIDLRLKKVRELIAKALDDFEPLGKEYLLCKVSEKYFIEAAHLPLGEVSVIMMDLLKLASNANEEQKKVLALLMIAGMNRMVELDSESKNTIPYKDALDFIQDVRIECSNHSLDVRATTENGLNQSISTIYSQRVNYVLNWVAESKWRASEDDVENKIFKGETTLFSFMRKKDGFESDEMLIQRSMDAIERIQLALETFYNGGRDYLLCRVQNCLSVETSDVEPKIIGKILYKLKELCLVEKDSRKLEALVEMTEACINSLAATSSPYERNFHHADVEYVARMKKALSGAQPTAHYWIGFKDPWENIPNEHFPLSQRYATQTASDGSRILNQGETYLFPLARGQFSGFSNAGAISLRMGEVIKQALKHFYSHGRDFILCKSENRSFIQTPKSLDVVCHLLIHLNDICTKEHDINKAYALAKIMQEGLDYIKPHHQNLLSTEFWRLTATTSNLVKAIHDKWENQKRQYGCEKIDTGGERSWIRVRNGFGTDTSNMPPIQPDYLNPAPYSPMGQRSRLDPSPLIRSETDLAHHKTPELNARTLEGETILLTLKPDHFADSKSYLNELESWISFALDKFEQGGKDFLLNTVRGCYFIEDPRIQSKIVYSLLNFFVRKAAKETRQDVLSTLAVLLKAGLDRLPNRGGKQYNELLHKARKIFAYLPGPQGKYFQNPGVDDQSQIQNEAALQSQNLHHPVQIETQSEEAEVEESEGTARVSPAQGTTSDGAREAYTKRERDGIDQAYFKESTFDPWERKNRKIAVQNAVLAGKALIDKLPPEYYDSTQKYRFAINIEDLAHQAGGKEANEFLDNREKNRNLKAPVTGLREVTGDLPEMTGGERVKSKESSNATQILENVVRLLTQYAEKKGVNVTQSPSMSTPLPRKNRPTKPALGTDQGKWSVVGGRKREREYHSQSQTSAFITPPPATDWNPSPAKKQRTVNQVPQYKSELIRQSTSAFIKELNKKSLKELMLETNNPLSFDQMKDLAATIFRKYELNSKKRIGEDKKTVEEARIFLKNQGFTV